MAQDGVLDLNLDTTDPLALHARWLCDTDFAELDCANSGAPGPQKLSIEVFAGDTVYVFVDGQNPGDHGKFSLTIKSHAPVCGDGVVQGAEVCDPPDGVTCGPDCQPMPEVCGDMIDNDGNGLTDCEDDVCAADPSCPNAGLCANAVPLGTSGAGDTTGKPAVFAGSCTGSGAPEQIFAVTPSADGILAVTLSSAADMGLYARTACTDAASEIACADAHVGGVDEHLAIGVQGGVPVTIFADGYQAGEAGPYTLTSAILPVDEVEPNDTPAEANPVASPFYGFLADGDDDYVAVTVPGPASKIIAVVGDVGNGACGAQEMDSEVEIYATDGVTSLAYDDDSGTGLCSQATAANLPAGAYFVRVGTPVGDVFAYKLQVVVQ